jgi:hypothetical protein
LQPDDDTEIVDESACCPADGGGGDCLCLRRSSASLDRGAGPFVCGGRDDIARVEAERDLHDPEHDEDEHHDREHRLDRGRSFLARR